MLLDNLKKSQLKLKVIRQSSS